MTIRDATLNGVRAASELHEKLGLRKTLKSGIENIDVFQTISDLDLPLLCKPLENLLGVYISKPNKGILVTTNRRLPIQRFTAAHELGHHVLGHEESYDSEDSMGLARQRVMQSPLYEIEAEAFAAEFLLPKWLLIAMLKRQGWGKSDLGSPETVYQLSLRAGISYEATWRCLHTNNLINQSTMEILKNTPPKVSKLAVLGDITPVDSWADAYFLTEKDNGSKLIASQEDTVIIQLSEHTSGGYVWSTPENNNSIDLINDERIKQQNFIGGQSVRKIALRGKNISQLKMKEYRQWEDGSNPINNFNVTLDFSGKEVDLPRVTRP